MILPKPQELADVSTWNKRYREMESLVHQGPEARAIIVEALNILKDNKDLSFGERKMLDLALNYDKIKAEHEAKVKRLDEYIKKEI